MKINYSRRVYPDGTWQDNGVLEEHSKDHIAYNLTYRPGCGLIVNGHIISPGICDLKLLDKHAKIVKNNKPPNHRLPYR